MVPRQRLNIDAVCTPIGLHVQQSASLIAASGYSTLLSKRPLETAPGGGFSQGKSLAQAC